MTDIIKTWPAFMEPALVQRIFRRNWAEYYFTLGRGKPQREIARIWFTHRGRMLGSFKIERLVINDGSLPKLTRIDGGESEWQIKPDRWVAICSPPFEWLEEEIYHEAFRGWHYFDLASYKETPDARINLETA